MKKIAITNFRKIKENWELELAPVTDRVNLMFKKMWFNDLYDKRVRGI